MDYSPDAEGAPTATDALLVLTSDTGRPPGNPQIEAEQPDTATFVFANDELNRLGRASAIRLTNGWVVEWTERCG